MNGRKQRAKKNKQKNYKKSEKIEFERFRVAAATEEPPVDRLFIWLPLVIIINVIKGNYLMEYIKTLSVNCANISDDEKTASDLRPDLHPSHDPRTACTQDPARVHLSFISAVFPFSQTPFFSLFSGCVERRRREHEHVTLSLESV